MSEEEFFGAGNSVFLPDETISVFGNYKIKGDLEIAGVIETEKIKSTLYFNHTKKQFFLLKEYVSGKNHIDFFLFYDNVEAGLLFDKPGIFKTNIAFSVSSEETYLLFDFSKNTYIVQSEKNGKSYNSYYQKPKK